MLSNSARLGAQILKANLNRLDLPFKLTFCVTFRCQSRCKTCNIWQLKPENELTLQEIETFASKSSYLSWLNLTGGELFLRNDIVEICRAFAVNCKLFFLNFATNGLMPKVIPEKVKEILKLPVSRIVIGVSMDGPEEINDVIRGIPGDWKKGMETYRALRELAASHKNFRTYLGYTISPFNQGEFFNFHDAVKREIPDLKPQDIHVNLFHHSSHYYYTDEGARSAKLDIKEVEAIEKWRSRATINPVDILERRYLSLAKDYLASGKTPLPCHAVATSCYVDSWGNVFPCTIYDKKIGSLRESGYDLAAIVKSAAGEEAKQEAVELKCPNCWTPCEAYQMILSNGLKRTRR